MRENERGKYASLNPGNVLLSPREVNLATQNPTRTLPPHIHLAPPNERRPAIAQAEVVCRDHQAYIANEALLARGRRVAAVFAQASISATVQTFAGAASGPEHYHLGAAPWLVEAHLTLNNVAWWHDAFAPDATVQIRTHAADRLAHLCWGVAAAAGRLREPAGALTLIDNDTQLYLKLGFDLHADQFTKIMADIPPALLRRETAPDLPALVGHASESAEVQDEIDRLFLPPR